ncbi:MAG: glutamine synthetase III [Clostridia bacterium]|nr:glutamine synthetase III [Clostridia bacterium]
MCDDIRRSFGRAVFGDEVMKERLPEDVYVAMKKTIDGGRRLDPSVASEVARAMKEWALELGATHFTHWFQPLSGVTAEKHDAFLSPAPDGTPITEFSGKELFRGEPDASSFPSGGLRATFEARGYTAWDPTSYAFVKDRVLCVPTAFCSYGGEALDKKTPLLRSMEVINKQALRVLRALGDETTAKVNVTVGAEQEFFLIRKEDFDKRRDLIYTGRTLFGAPAPKDQQLDDHYFGAFKPAVSAFMDDLNAELWALGIYAKTEHNEVAPAQHEIAPVFCRANIACDQNQLMMEIMKKVAARHGMVCLLHEKPFEGVNGSGKHNNWSLSTDTGKNLLDPGDTPQENVQFLVFLSAVVCAVDEYQDLLRASVASAGNDHRLGKSEAPPAIVSVFLGDELTGLLRAVVDGERYTPRAADVLGTGVHVLPKIPKDNTDRNRTSPFAFTGNKFEFRMVGSSDSIAGANIALNAAVADELCSIADDLEGKDGSFETVSGVLRERLGRHFRIIFNGDGYGEEWIEEAGKRGLLNLPTTADAVVRMLDSKNIELFRRTGVYSEAEAESRCEIMLDNYAKKVAIEANTMVDMINHDILPSAVKYSKVLSDGAAAKKAISPRLSICMEEKLLDRLADLTDELYECSNILEESTAALRRTDNAIEAAELCRDRVLSDMHRARVAADGIEKIVGREFWCYPTYGDLMHDVR